MILRDSLQEDDNPKSAFCKSCLILWSL